MKPCSPLKSTWGISTICDIKLDLFYVLLFLLLTCFFTTGTQGSTSQQTSSKADLIQKFPLNAYVQNFLPFATNAATFEAKILFFSRHEMERGI